MRSVILHHHLFKNAGTSVDLALERAFGRRWRAVEGEGRELTGADLARLLDASPELVALSSHTFRPPFLVREDIRLLPIVLLRHPLDRVRSAYAFERQQAADTYGARLAKELGFAGYVATRLERPGDRAIRDFQTHRLSPLRGASAVEELLAALGTLAGLPFVGLVENFAVSMGVFERLLAPEFGPLSLGTLHANAQAARPPLEERLRRAEDALGPELTARFHAANRADQRLFELVGWTHRLLRQA